jgi:hypothetical protein
VECPWAKATPPGQFSPRRYEALRDTTGTPDEQVGFTAPWFACHMAPEGGEFYCAGWMAAVGFWHIGVRLALAQGRVSRDAVRHMLEPADDDWPELYEDYAALLRVHGLEAG